MREATVLRVLVAAEARVERGTPLLEMRVDLGAVAEQNCPPVFEIRVVANEAGWIRVVNVGPGDVAASGAPLAIVSSLPDEPPDGPITRPMRVNVGVVAPRWSVEGT